MMKIILSVVAIVMAALSQARAMEAPREQPVALAGSVSNADLWRGYKKRFITEQGRVVDTGNGGISHSEGQGYGMLLAVAAKDRDAFDRIWNWTRANMMVRGDALLAWRWDADKRPAITDMNNATDGDMLVTWALIEADAAWNDMAYRVAARRIAVDIARKLVLPNKAFGPLLLPALAGFSADDRADGPTVNLSYWIFPALDRLATAAPEQDWDALSRSGVKLLEAGRFGLQKVPAEWTSLDKDVPSLAKGFAPSFAYNAVRIPLYLAWSSIATPKDFAPFVALWSKRSDRGLPLVDLSLNNKPGWLGENGYSAIADLTACAASNTLVPRSFGVVDLNENYYPVTLHLLSQIVVRTRYPSCLRG
jgi:endoglucanase